MKKRRVMIDGMLLGTELDGSLQLKASEAFKMKAILEKNGAQETSGGLCLTVPGKGPLVLALRKPYNAQDRYYLNISGNPLKFLRGSTVYGYAEADRVIITAYREALETLKGSVPDSIYKKVARREINIHSLEFATYTEKVHDVSRLLNDWYHIYTTSYSSKDGLSHHTLCDLLDLKITRKDPTHRSSVYLRIMSKGQREEEAMLMVYDKYQQLNDQQKSSIGLSDVKNRLRLDLHLNYGWFRRHSVEGRKLKTLRDLTLYVEKNYGGRWEAFCAAEFKWALDRTLLFYMWEFTEEEALGRTFKHPNKRVTSEVMDALNKARHFKSVSDEKWNKAIDSGCKIEASKFKPIQKLKLDMSVV